LATSHRRQTYSNWGDYRMNQQELLSRVIAASEGTLTISEDELVNAIDNVDPFISWYAAKAVGRCNVPSGVPKLVEALGRPSEPLGDNETDLRLISAWSLGKFQFEIVWDCIYPLLQTDNTLLRAGIADALGQLGDARALPALVKLSKDGPYEVRLWAALALSKIGDPARPYLRSLLEEAGTQADALIYVDALEKLDRLTPEAG